MEKKIYADYAVASYVRAEEVVHCGLVDGYFYIVTTNKRHPIVYLSVVRNHPLEPIIQKLARYLEFYLWDANVQAMVKDVFRNVDIKGSIFSFKTEIFEGVGGNWIIWDYCSSNDFQANLPQNGGHKWTLAEIQTEVEKMVTHLEKLR